MYRTCLFCNADLGANELVETFPVGRRLAFDAAKGRLWVVCRTCERWNLTPLEERWEAIEQCERLFRDTRLRVSTDNVGLARLKEGLELVRIGAPQRPELAAWRYGDQFGRRRRRALLMTGAAVVGVGVIAAGGWAAGIGFGALGQLPNYVNMVRTVQRTRKRVRIPLADGGIVETTMQDGNQARLFADGDVPSLKLRLVPAKGARSYSGARVPETVLHGDDAIRAAGLILAHVNVMGGRASQVREAVQRLEAAPSIEAVFTQSMRELQQRHERRFIAFGGLGTLSRMPPDIRLALEMAAHEEQERRALEGELAELERAWRDAEEIAGIADDMFVSDHVKARLDRLK